jgi:hypothetical protein
MIITQRTTSVAKGLDNILLHTYVSLPVATTPLINLATKISTKALKHTSDTYRIIKLEEPRITSQHLAPAVVELGGDNRNLAYTLLSHDIVQTLHPASITISVELLDQSILAHDKIAVEILARYELKLREIKLKEAIDKQAPLYLAKYGSQVTTPTEITVRDLSEVTRIFKSNGMVPSLSQYLSSVAINTSGIPKAFALVGSFEATDEVKRSIGASTLNSYKGAHEYSGAMNYAFNFEGVELISGVALISSNNYKSSNTDPNIHTMIAQCADSVIMAIDTPTKGSIIKRSGLILSPTALISQTSVRCPIICTITRPEGVMRVAFSKLA